jgi:hypothetical protein
LPLLEGCGWSATSWCDVFGRNYDRPVPTWDDVRHLVAALPETIEDGDRCWRVRDKLIAWHRPLRPGDLKALGAAAPAEAPLAVRVLDLGVKQALLASNQGAYFTTPHFDNYPAVLIQLAQISPDELAEVLTEAWLSRAPKRLAKVFLAEHER